MSMPGLDTSQVSYIGYWNALDHGVTSIDPYETESAMQTYTEYSNGVEGTITFDNGRVANCRVKDDGWFMVWLDRTKDTGVQKSSLSDTRGVWDIVYRWEEARTSPDTEITPTFDDNEIVRAISSLQSALSNSPTYSYSDVSMWNYETKASNITGLTMGNRGNGSKSFDATWQAGTDVKQWLAFGVGDSAAVIHDSGGDDIYIAADASTNFGAYDALNNGSVTDGETITHHQQSNGWITAGEIIDWG